MSIVKIDVARIFERLDDEVYCIIKISNEFPAYKKGSDIDIFCYSINDISRIIIDNLDSLLDVRVTYKGLQMYVDILDENQNIELRFDLYQALPNYINVKIKDGYFSSILESSVLKEINSYKVKVPSLIDDVILRYIEYQEWYGRRPDKIKHINYINSLVKDQDLNFKLFLDKLHFYTVLPPVSVEINSKDNNRLLFFKNIIASIQLLLKTYKQYGYSVTVKKIRQRILK